MRSLQYTQPGLVEWVDAPDAALRDPGDALVHPVASAMCDLDRRIAAGTTGFTGPFPIGHEAVARIDELGADAAAGGLHVGQTVLVPLNPACGTCAQCQAGRSGTCASIPSGSAFGVASPAAYGGLFDDAVRVPFAAHSLLPLPPGLDPWLAAAAADSMTDAYRLVAPTLAAQPDASVLVLNGTPTLGSLVVMFARALGAGEILFCDRDPARARRAHAVGASEVRVGELPDRVDGHFPLVVDCSGQPEAGPACAVRSVAPGGTCAFGSVYFGDISLPYRDAYHRGVELRIGRPHVQPNAPTVLRMLAEGAVDPAPVLTPPLAYGEAPRLMLDPPTGKAVFVR
jgi:alcohol dehydrogenase